MIAPSTVFVAGEGQHGCRRRQRRIWVTAFDVRRRRAALALAAQKLLGNEIAVAEAPAGDDADDEALVEVEQLLVVGLPAHDREHRDTATPLVGAAPTWRKTWTSVM